VSVLAGSLRLSFDISAFTSSRLYGVSPPLFLQLLDLSSELESSSAPAHGQSLEPLQFSASLSNSFVRCSATWPRLFFGRLMSRAARKHRGRCRRVLITVALYRTSEGKATYGRIGRGISLFSSPFFLFFPPPFPPLLC